MCDIGDASRGSLSSYAYTLMVLFFLQQRNPPVIPVLQEVQKPYLHAALLLHSLDLILSSFTDWLSADLCWREEAWSTGWWLERVLLWWFESTSKYCMFLFSHKKTLFWCVTTLLCSPAAQSLAPVRNEHRDSGGAVPRPSPLLHRRLWLQRTRRVHPAARPPHHLQQTVDLQIHRHRRFIWSDTQSTRK